MTALNRQTSQERATAAIRIPNHLVADNGQRFALRMWRPRCQIGHLVRIFAELVPVGDAPEELPIGLFYPGDIPEVKP